MRKEEIIRTLEQNDSTILSFPERGPWGDKRYRGNCSGWIQAFLIWKYQVKKFAELFAGSGTGYDVANDMGISYVGADLNPRPVRPGILCVDAMLDEVPDAFFDADMIFMHPPYGLEIGIPYAGSMYPDPGKELSKKDLGQMPWQTFMKTLNHIIMKYYAAMETGSKMSILMGDVRRKGRFHSMLMDIVKPGELEQVIIKQQHNTMSGGRTYAHRNFVPLVHEYIMVLKKMMPYLITFKLPTEHEMDLRDSKSATWKDVVWAVMQELKGENRPIPLSEIYEQIKDNKKCQTNANWEAKVRQTLQKSSLFSSNQRGMWQIAA